MSELIELTEEEINAGASAVAIAGGMGFEDRRLLVQTFAWAVNKMRGGDPVGTIRRTDHGTIALLTANETETPWRVLSSLGTPMGGWAQQEVSTWEVIYRPEAS